MPSCCAYGCTNSAKSGYKLYRIPAGKRNEQRRKLWLLMIGRDKWNPNENSKLCEVHFTDDQFENHRADNRRLLKQTALPSIFCHRPPPQKSRKTSKNVIMKGSIDFPVSDTSGDQEPAETVVFGNLLPKNIETEDQDSMKISEFKDAQSGKVPGNDVQDSKEIPVFEDTQSEKMPGFDLLADSRKEIENLKGELNLLQRKFQQNKQEMENLQKHLSVLFTDDQIALMKKGFSKGLVWSDDTIDKALRLYLSC